MIDYLPLKRSPGSRRKFDRQISAICQECGVGCGLVAYMRQGRIVDVHGDEQHPVSRGRLCAAGISFPRALYSLERFKKPFFRSSPGKETNELDNLNTALDILAERLKRTRDLHGPEALFIGCDTKAGLGFYYGAKRFAALWGTPNLFSPFEEPQHHNQLNVPSNFCSEWPSSKGVLIVFSDLATTHPVAFRWILEAQNRGAKIAVVDTHFTPTMSKANLACIIKPDSGNILGMALMKALLDKENFFGSLIKEKFSDAESWRKSFDIMSLDTALRVCGIEEQTILELAGFLTKLQPCQLITGKKLAYMAGYGIWRTLAEAMDLPTVEGGGWYPLDSGRPPIDVTKDIESQNRQFSKNQIFGYPYLKNLFTTSSNGADYPIKAVICSGNCMDDYFASLERFCKALDITAYLGAFQNRTSSFANIIFPSALWPERDDLFFTNDRAIHLAKRITKPDYETRSGLDFWMGLAQRLGFGDHFPWKTPQNDSDSEAFHDWILAQSPLTEYCTKRLFDSELDKSSLITWPCRIEDLEEARRTKDLHNLGELRHKLRIGSERSHEAIESFRGKSLIPAPALSSNELSNLEQDDLQKFPLYVEAPSTICQTMTVDFTRPNFYQEPGVYYLRINPEMAQALGIFTGDIVKIEGQGMILEAVALPSRAMPRWLIHLNSPIGEGRVLVYRKGGSSESALSIIGKVLSNK